MAQSMTPFLMFEGRAGEAIEFYQSVFFDSSIVHMTKYGPDGPGPEGTIITAMVTINGQKIMFSDSFVKHQFSFTPSMSFWIDCADAEELERLFAALGADGQIYMPLDDYGFSTRFGWVGDRFGVTWQLNLA